MATKPSGDRSEELEDALPKLSKDASAPTHLRRSTRLQQQALETARMNFLNSNPYLPMDSIGMYKAATCRIHLCHDDPYKELLHNVDEVETLLQDPVDFRIPRRKQHRRNLRRVKSRKTSENRCVFFLSLQ